MGGCRCSIGSVIGIDSRGDACVGGDRWMQVFREIEAYDKDHFQVELLFVCDCFWTPHYHRLLLLLTVSC